MNQGMNFDANFLNLATVLLLAILIGIIAWIFIGAVIAWFGLGTED